MPTQEKFSTLLLYYKFINNKNKDNYTFFFCYLGEECVDMYLSLFFKNNDLWYF